MGHNEAGLWWFIGGAVVYVFMVYCGVKFQNYCRRLELEEASGVSSEQRKQQAKVSRRNALRAVNEKLMRERRKVQP